MARGAAAWERAEMRLPALLCLALAACGGAARTPTDAGDPVDAGVADAGAPDASVEIDGGIPDAGPALHNGVLAAVKGVRYLSGATSGVTDAQGAFVYEDGARVAFYS